MNACIPFFIESFPYWLFPLNETIGQIERMISIKTTIYYVKEKFVGKPYRKNEALKLGTWRFGHFLMDSDRFFYFDVKPAAFFISGFEERF